MSKITLSKFIRFLAIAGGLIIALSFAWTLVESYYNDLMVKVADFSASPDVIVEAAKGTISFDHIIPYRGGSLQVTDWIDVSAIQFGLILAVALVAATPGLSFKKRILYSIIALLLTFFLQFVAVIVAARTFSSILFVVVSDLLPPLIWAVFSFKYWFGKQKTSNASTESHKQHPVKQPANGRDQSVMGVK